MKPSKDFNASVSDDAKVLVINANNVKAMHRNCLFVNCHNTQSTGDGQIWINDILVEFNNLSDDARSIIEALQPWRIGS